MTCKHKQAKKNVSILQHRIFWLPLRSLSVNLSLDLSLDGNLGQTIEFVWKIWRNLALLKFGFFSSCPHWRGFLPYVLKAAVKSSKVFHLAFGFFAAFFCVKVPLWDVHVHFERAGSHKMWERICFFPRHRFTTAPCPFFEFVHFVWQVWDIWDILWSKTSFCVTNTGIWTLSHLRDRRDTFLMLLKRWRAWVENKRTG